MFANAVFVATLIFLALGFWLMHALHFLVPWRGLILHSYLRSIPLYCVLLFANSLGLTIWPSDELDEEDKYMDRSIDQVARVRAAKEAAQREMESFGDVSEYEVTVIQGQLKEEPVGASQSTLEFRDDASTAHQEGD